MVRRRTTKSQRSVHPLALAAVDAGVTDREILAAVAAIPREHFLPADVRQHANTDRPLPIGHNQTASQPSLQARMIDAAGITSASTVLEIGTGCGYQTALLARIAQRVVSVEIDPKLSATASAALARLSSDMGNIAATGTASRDTTSVRESSDVAGGSAQPRATVTTVCGHGRDGWLYGAPYDAIIVSYGAPSIADAWRDQLAIDGRLVVPLTTNDDSGRSGRTDVRVFVQQPNGLVEHETVCAAYFVDERHPGPQ